MADHGFVEFTARRVVDVFYAGLAEAKLGFFEQACEPLVFAGKALGIDEQSEALVEGQLGQFTIFLLVAPCSREGVEAQVT